MTELYFASCSGELRVPPPGRGCPSLGTVFSFGISVYNSPVAVFTHQRAHLLPATASFAILSNPEPTRSLQVSRLFLYQANMRCRCAFCALRTSASICRLGPVYQLSHFARPPPAFAFLKSSSKTPRSASL